ncbi:MAG: DUF3108 domain-containing protein [Rhodomicrobiaceae bacterium]
MLLPLPARADQNSAIHAEEAWPTDVRAAYSLRFNGIEVGRLKLKFETTATSYSLSGSAKVSVLFGAFRFSGSSSVSGAVQQGRPTPEAYKFHWKRNKKLERAIEIAFEDRTAKEIAIKPRPKVRPDTVPLEPAHKVGAFDPLSAVLMLTKADGRPPCDRRVNIFDGNHRYDIVLTPKRLTRLPPSSAGRRPETGHVCRIAYEPVAGHRDNDDTKAHRSNRDVEIVLRHIPGSEMLIPYAVNIPTEWGTGSMVAERIDVMTTTAGKVAFTN